MDDAMKEERNNYHVAEELKARIDRSVSGDVLRHTSCGGNKWRSVWVATGDRRWIMISANEPTRCATGDLLHAISEDGFSVAAEKMVELVSDPGSWRLTKWEDD